MTKKRGAEAMIENRKHCADAERRAVVRAETCADAYAEFRAVPRADHLQNPVQMSVQKHGAERRWKPVQVAVQSLMQMLVQIIVQKNGTDAEIRGEYRL
jgi:hypothetical protein